MSREEIYTYDDSSSSSEEEPMEITEIPTQTPRPNQENTENTIPDALSVEERIAKTKRKLLTHQELTAHKQPKTSSTKEWALLTTRDYSRCFTEIVAKVHADLLSGRIKMAGVTVTDRNALKCNRKWDKNADRERMTRNFTERMKMYSSQRCNCWQCVIRCEKQRAKARARLLPKPIAKDRCVLTEALFETVDHSQTPCEDAALADLRRRHIITEEFEIIQNLCEQRNIEHRANSTQTIRRVIKVNECTQTDLNADVGIQKGADLTRIRLSQEAVHISEGSQVCMPEPPHLAKPVAKVVGVRHRFFPR